jgi:uncharacterized protein YeeX (DUF496 family)
LEISLLEALPLRNAIARRIQELLQERDRVAFVEFEKGEEYEKPERSVEEITTELNEVREDYRKLDVLVAKANLEAKVEWDGKEITITEAIELAKQLRGEASKLKNYGRSKKQERKYSIGDTKTVYRKALFEPSEMQKQGLKLERMADRLSLAIEKANHLHTIKFDAAEKYL